MNHFWDGTFLTPSVAGLRYALAFAREMLSVSILGVQFGQQPPGLILLLALAAGFVVFGMFALVLHSRLAASLILGPIALALLASAGRQYPMASRLWLFSVPLVLLLFVIGFEWIVNSLAARWRNAVGAVIALIYITPASQLAIRLARSPALYQHARPVVRAALSELRPNEPLYVFARSIPAWLFYSTDWTNGVQGARELLRELSPPDGAAFYNASNMGRLTAHSERILTRRIGGRLEVLGVGSGYRTTFLTHEQPQVDSVWAVNELARVVRAASGGCAVLFAAFVMRDEEAALLDELSQRGARIRWRFAAPGSKAVRMCWTT
jgi:hypothetical protein